MSTQRPAPTTPEGTAPVPAPAPVTAPVAPVDAPPGGTGNAIEVTGLNLYYGRFHAVEDVSMNIERNKVTALIGSSGCGKSTFLRSLNRMHEVIRGAHARGTVLLEGQDIYAPDVDPVLVLLGLTFTLNIAAVLVRARMRRRSGVAA